MTSAEKSLIATYPDLRIPLERAREIIPANNWDNFTNRYGIFHIATAVSMGYETCEEIANAILRAETQLAY